MNGVVVDTGPLVALLDRRDAHHEWARRLLTQVRPPLRTCEAVLSEACFLLRHVEGGPDAVLALLARNVVSVTFRLEAESGPVRRLMQRYGDTPMALADACLVRMTEIDAGSTVLTLDTDFRVYRKHGTQAVPTILPGSE